MKIYSSILANHATLNKNTFGDGETHAKSGNKRQGEKSHFSFRRYETHCKTRTNSSSKRVSSERKKQFLKEKHFLEESSRKRRRNGFLITKSSVKRNSPKNREAAPAALFIDASAFPFSAWCFRDGRFLFR